MRRIAIALACLVVGFGLVCHADLPPGLARIAQEAGLRHATIAIYAAYVSGGQPLLAHNQELLLVPASGMKLLTTSAALDLLGPEYRHRTVLRAEWADGKGTLSAIGGGDPLLDTTDLDAMVTRLCEAGMPDGLDVTLDLSRYGGETFAPGWQLDDLGYYYLPTLSALAVGKNVVEVFVSPGDPPRATVVPQYGEVRFEGGAGPLSVVREPGRDVYVVRGAVPAGHATDKPVQALSIADPTPWATHWLRSALARVPAGSPRQDGKAEVVHEGKPLFEIVQAINKPSDNFLAEMLFLELGYARTGLGSFRSGTEAVLAFARKAGLASDAVRVGDGSGLSRLNLVTAGSMVALLRYAPRQPWGDAFRESIPLAGKEGTVAKRLSDLVGRVRAKTGTMGGACSLSGYVWTKSGRVAAFCIIVNHGDTAAARRLQDETVRWLYRDQEAREWFKQVTARRTSSSTPSKDR
ncbi:MAG: D-alanyl-D-alanine carboxypeptidase/D-alanyl-D-alanine-endopeptidase [Fimbriimonadia bacterium]|jgi:D-alanyl-D-alanine carboxypeptidase/D-alanyl-D-alanine-endopeptidase (penicillin-binding protein 4)